MNRTGLIVALVIAAIVGTVFGLFPELDLAIAAPFYAMTNANHDVFAWRLSPALNNARDAGLWVGTVLVAPAIVAVIMKLVVPRRKMFISGSAAIFLMLTMAAGPGLLVNVILKDHWGRPRPIDVTQFGGDQHFVPWWDPRGDCPGNCSFVSGDVSGAFWTLAPASLAPPQWRVLAYGCALALGGGMAIMRMMAGAHFFTDTVFAGVFTFLVIWLTHGLVFRWRTRFAAGSVERALENISTPALLTRLFHRKTQI